MWRENLKNIANKCSKGEYQTPTEKDMEEIIRYYDIKIRREEEEMTISECEYLESCLEIIQKYAFRTYPKLKKKFDQEKEDEKRRQEKIKSSFKAENVELESGWTVTVEKKDKSVS